MADVVAQRGWNMLTSRAVLRWILRRVTIGTIEVRWSDGTEQDFSGASDGARVHIDIEDEAAFAKALIDDGALGLGASYVEGAWDSPDLAGFLELASRNIDTRQSTVAGSRISSVARSWWDRRPAFARSTPIGEIGDHYNLGNDFYASWLDPTMTYSSARFTRPNESLEDGQIAKYRNLCEMLALEPGERVLEIGCGWGGFMEYAALHHGVHVTGLTLSEEMAAFARKRLAEAGVSERTTVKLQDFRDEHAMYDKVVSIEMIESVDDSVWPSLFHAISRAIPPGGRAAMQAITIDPRWYGNLLVREDFIKRYIFPGGALPTIDVLRDLATAAGLVWIEESTHGRDYAETLHRWSVRFDAAWRGIMAADPVFDERFRRMWTYYLEYCEAGFRTGRIDGVQILMERPAP
jgi:cyclopropane-fatty-acyl-phospholipid synthase